MSLEEARKMLAVEARAGFASMGLDYDAMESQRTVVIADADADAEEGR